VLLLTAISLQRVGVGLVLLVAFSAGMAVVLTGIGLGVVYGKGRWGESGLGGSVWGRRLPVVAAGVIVLVGVWMTGMALRG
jgi:ABC-type nickel/cobalt efflux system permease component RcnA